LADYEVIIIDDFTPDRSVPLYIRSLIKNYPKMRLVENTENMGFVKTVNKGIVLSNGEYVCLLNQDTELRKNFIEKNVAILDANDSIAGLSCTIVDKYGENWWTGGSFHGGFPINTRDNFEGIRRVDFVAGTAPFYIKEVFRKIGLFDESYRMYHEDVEFGLRIRNETDYRICSFAEKLVVHYHINAKPGREAGYLMTRNRMLIARRYFPHLIPLVIFKYVTSKTKDLGYDMKRLHPWALLVDAWWYARGIAGIFAVLLKNPRRIPRLVN
jgi:GT2 family glycosyltransferase